MNAEIRSQLIRMTVILALLAGMAIWQIDFVINAINANVFLNGLILLTFAFGVVVAYRGVFGLRNEFIAYHSLREDYEDVISSEEQDTKDPLWRYYRCEEHAVIFQRPRILEQPYQIISEEIARTRHLSMSTGVMQNLLDSVDEQLEEGQSLVTYITGLQVFLGLMGTFVGLMVTLSSVGSIIGNLDLSGGGGNDAIQRLMSDLKVPLNGMATGFSSSLFGLITSLALGLIGRFAKQASGVLKADFAAWLAGVAKVDGEAMAAAANGGTGPGGFSLRGERMLAMMYRVAKLSLVSNARVVTTVEQMAGTTQALLDAQIRALGFDRGMADAVQAVAHGQIATTEAIAELAGLMESRAELVDLIGRLDHTAARQAHVQKALDERLTHLLDRQHSLQERAAAFERNMIRRDEIETLAADAQEQLGGEFARLHGSFEDLRGLLGLIETGVGHGNQALRMTHKDLAALSDRLDGELTEAVAESRESIARAAALAEQVRALSVADMQQVLHDHFSAHPAEPRPKAPVETKDRGLLGVFRRRA